MGSDYARVRAGRGKDARELMSVFRQSWALAYAGIIPEMHLKRLIGRRDYSYWRRVLTAPNRPIVLEAGGVPAGYATWGKARGRGANEGEIYELYLSPVYQGLGLGELLFEAARQRLDEDGARTLVVWALTDNQSAIDFYLRRGGRPTAKSFECYGNVRVPKTAFAWS